MKNLSPDVGVNAQVVVGFELRATVQLASGNVDAAAGFVQLAADVSARNHPGWFVSPAMEELIGALGASLDADEPGVDATGPVVHVLAGEAGTIIQEAREWWRMHPEARLLALPDRTSGPLDAARELRAQMGGASMVVVHGTGAAIAPLVALAGWARRPPAVFIEPQQLGFWAGIGVFDAVVHNSTTAMALAGERRCLPTGRSVLVEPHEREAAQDLLHVLGEIRERIPGWPTPRPPTALLPAMPALIDQRVLSQQVEMELTDGVSGALLRWQVPSELTARPGWVVVARDPDRVLATIRSLLSEEPQVFPDVVVVDVDATGNFEEFAVELAGVVEVLRPDQPLSLELGIELGVRQLVSDQLLITTDGAGPDAGVIGEMEIRLRTGEPAVGVSGLPEGERCEMRRHPRLVGWPVAVALGHPAGGRLRVEAMFSDDEPTLSDRTSVRETTEITEKRGELFHTESEVPMGPSDPE
ncbi:MAG: hypothetical protein P8N02_16330 [Actinomycetota bacterium]|nr:hypothetical protein [Actinomycetota bacterium]